eukprot:5164490-Prorocentrum_lima.AAC.1
MTSSLVGSEMCIRDRKRRERMDSIMDTSPAGLSERAQELQRITRREPPKSCLLYTSDAADDM